MNKHRSTDVVAADGAPAIVVASGVIQDLTVERGHIGGRASLRLVDLDGPESFRTATVGARALVVNTHPVSRESMAAMDPDVAIIARAGTGLDAIDLEAARDLGLVVYHTPDYCVEEVATHTVAWIFALVRHLLPSDEVARTDFQNWRAVGPIRPLSELTIGIVGGGRIGAMTARILRPVARSVAIYDPYATPRVRGARIERTLEDLLRRSDVVALHCPLTESTYHLLGARELALMPRGAMLVNCSRGGLVDETSLLDALDSGHLSGAALDVLEEEPPSAHDPVLRSRRVSLSPHTGWYSTASEERVRTQALDGILAVLRGDVPTAGRIAVAQPVLRGTPRAGDSADQSR